LTRNFKTLLLELYKGFIMEIIVTIPQSYPAERDYIISVILKEFLGLDYVIQRTGRANVCISDKDNRRRLIIADCLFAISEEQWLTNKSLPKQPLNVLDHRLFGFDNALGFPSLPVIYGDLKSHLDGPNHAQNTPNGQEFWLPIDIFGACFFMLTRYEELVKTDRDEHNRFPPKAMLAHQEGFIERPIVNEYIEILWSGLKRVWPSLIRKKREYRLLLSHDVDDILSVVGKPLKQVIRRIGGDLIVRRDLIMVLRNMQAAWLGCAEKDPFNTFDFIMDLSEKNGVSSTFNFMTDLGHTKYDQRYNIDHPWARHCLRRIVQRGHLIGFHPTYGSYLNAERTKSEFLRLKMAAEEEGAEQNEWGGRQHYLRWQNPTTWQHWEEAGLNYDSTLGFADLIGFRTGCCYEYPVFNLQERKKLNLRERSLMVMDGTVTDRDGTITNILWGKIFHLNDICKKFSGDFTLLWHNGKVASRRQRKLYLSTIDSIL